MRQLKKNLLLITSALLIGGSSFSNPDLLDREDVGMKKQEVVKSPQNKKQSTNPVKPGPPPSFKKSAEISSFPWTESFENGGSIPGEWTQSYVSGSNLDWQYISGNGGSQPSSAKTGTYNACLVDTDTGNDETKLISPALNFSTAASATLTFYMYMNKRSGKTDALKIYYKTSATGTWTLLQSYTSRVSSWTQRTISLPNLTSEYYLAFEGNAKYGWGVCVDDVEVTIVPNPTPIDPISTFPWLEDFEDGGSTPADWTEDVVSGTASWAYLTGNGASNPSTAHGGTYNACLRDYDSADDLVKLISPPLDFTGINSATLTFWHTQEFWPNDQDQLKVYYRTSSSGTWTQIAYYNTNIDVWTEVVLDLPNLSDDYYIAFEGNAKYGYGVCVDDVLIEGEDAPVVEFSADVINPELDQAVQFTDQSANNPTSWLWSFSPSTVTYISGDASSQNPIVSFNAAGLYAVTLTAANSTGSTTEIKSSYIYISDGSFYPNALTFDGVNEYVSVANSTSLNIGGPYADRTIEAWFYCTNVSNSSKKQVIFEEGDETRGFNIYIYNGSLYVGGWNNDPTESNWSGTWLSSPMVYSNTWHHVALRLEDGTDSPTAGNFSGLLDGIVFDTGVGAKVYAHTGGTNIGRTANTKFHDGLDNTSLSYVEGIIDEVRVWNDARSNEEIRGNMYRQLSETAISSNPNLAAYFTMDHPSGTNLRDFSGNLNDGTLYNMANENWIPSTSLYSLRQSLDFDGVNDYVSLGKSEQLKLTNVITIEAWIYPRSISQWGAIVSNLQNNGSNESGYGLVLNGDDGELVWWLQTVGGAVNDDANYPKYTPVLDTWQHVACTYNGSEMKLYVDGVVVDSKVRHGAIDWSFLPIDARIGAYVDDNEQYYFDGQIDDVRIWGKSLTASEIAESMSNHLWGTETGLAAYYRFDQLNDVSQTVLYNVAGDFGSTIYTQNFDSYSNNDYVSTIPNWYTWSGGTGTAEDPLVKTTEASSLANSMRITTTNDIVYLNGDLTSGTHSVKFNMFVPSGKYGYFNLEHFDTPATEWAVDVFFDGSGNGSITAAGVTNAATFSFNTDEWFNVEVLVNLDDDLATVYINNTAIHTWQWSINNGDGTAGTNQLGCVDFFAYTPGGGITPLFYIDDFSVTQVDAPEMNGILVNMEPTVDWEGAVTTNLWTGAANSDWANASNWLTGGVPVSTDVVRIERTETGNYPVLTSDQGAAKLTIAEGASLTIQLNQQFDVANTLLNYGTLSVSGILNIGGKFVNYDDVSISGQTSVGGELINNGNIVVLSDADVTGSLIDNGEVSGYGSFTVQRYMSSSEKWHLISSSVKTAYSAVFLDRYLLSYNENSDIWNNILLADVRLRPMMGYATMNNSSTVSADTYSFVGAINTGDYTYTLSHSGTNPDNQNFNLIGNPYPSSIDWDLVTIPANMGNAVYYLKPNGQYASYANRISVNGGTRYISPGQGFWVRVSTGTPESTVVNFTLTNSLRSHLLKDQYFKEVEGAENEYQFSVFATNGKVTDEAILIFNNATVPQFDSRYDALKFPAYERNIPNIYFIGADKERLSIDTRPETPMVELGFMMNETTKGIKINVKEAPNFAAIVLEDMFTGIKTDLLKDSYVFDYSTKDVANRFKMHFSFLGTDDISYESGIKIYSSQSDIIINSGDGLDNPVMEVYDMQGRLVYNESLGYTTLKRVPLSLRSGAYIVKLILEEGVKSQKVYLQ